MKPHLRNLLRFHSSINNNELINTQKLTSGDNLCCFNLRLISYFLVLQAVGIPTLIFLGLRSEELVDIWQAMLLGMEILLTISSSRALCVATQDEQIRVFSN